ncbi:MAG: hypothetical protein L3J67_09020 [Hyphomicrobiaceae bacterium]|nr:hypothetical protein [Hyphomicrobiaceae bacterium]
MTIFNVIDKGKTGDLLFQYKNVTRRHKGRNRHKWKTAIARTIIRGRYIILRARSSKGADVISLRIRGNCIEAPSIPASAGKTNNTSSHKY